MTALSRGWVATVAAVTAAAMVGVAFSLAVGLSATWRLMAVGAAVGFALLSWWPSLRDFALLGYFLTLPILITKALATGAAVYGPALEITLSDIFLVLMAVAWVRGRTHLRPPPNVGWAPWLAGAILSWAWIAAAYAERPDYGMLSAITLSKQLAGFWLVARLVQTPRDVRRVLAAAGAGLTLQLAMAVLQFVTRSPIQLQGGKGGDSGLRLVYEGGAGAFRPFGFLLHPNILGVYLVLLLPTLIVLVLLGRRRLGARSWWLAGALLIGGIGALVVTLSRGSWISFALAAAFLFFVGWRKGLVSTRQLRIAAVSALAGVAIIVAAYPNALRRLTSSDDRSTESRWLMLQQASLIIREHPIFGVGLAGYKRATAEEVPASFGALPKDYQKGIKATLVHNAFLLQWAERGIVGLTLTLLLFSTLIGRFLQRRHWYEPTLEAVALGLVAGLVGQLSCYLFENQFLDYRPGTLWPQIGLLVAIYRLQRRQAAIAPALAAA